MSDKGFFLFMNLDMVDRNSAPEEFAYIWQSKGVGIITIETEKNMNSLFHATFSWLSAVVVSFKNSLVFTQDAWPMQAWIPVVSSSLYFWKSVFSFRADSILKSDGDFISNWKFPDCVHFFGAWARQVNSHHVRTHKKNSGDAVRRLGTIIQSIFCVQSGASICLTESVPRGSSARAWKLSSRLFSQPDWLPGLQGWFRAHLLLLNKHFVCSLCATHACEHFNLK